MPRSAAELRRDALQIWHAAVAAVDSARLVRQAVQVEAGTLVVGGERLAMADIGRIVVVGAGKAGTGMAAGLLAALGPRLAAEKHLTGWLNVPADCVRPLPPLVVHAARPASVNEPTAAGAAGAEEILRLVSGLGPSDVCFCLISGGASALLPAPAEGITLADKLAVTRHLSAAGANIAELNAVRKQLSRIKGGALARACCSGRLITLIISDVLGDPLDVIASGPTVADRSTPAEALAVLERFGARQAGISPAVFDYLTHAAGQRRRAESDSPCQVHNLVIGNNATAVAAAGREAERLGYAVQTFAAAELEGAAEDIGRDLAARALAMRGGAPNDCFISGGEPTVRLVEAARRGMGGRNQQLALAALERLAADGAPGIALVSGGTDGEDGPTDAAGAVVDADIIAAARNRGLDPAAYLVRNDAYHFFEPVGGLIRTGPTHTNVCDIRVVLVEPARSTGQTPVG